MNYRRSRTKGGVYFFTVVTHHRFPIFNEKENIHILRAISNDVCEEFPFKEIACVILPEHIHSIWKLPCDDYDFSKRWSIIKSRFTKQIYRNLNVNAHKEQIWQKRFWEHEIRDSSDLNHHIDYIHYNPVKHGLVNNVIDWPYSSFQRFVEKGYYNSDWGSGIVFGTGDKFGE